MSPNLRRRTFLQATGAATATAVVGAPRMSGAASRKLDLWVEDPLRIVYRTTTLPQQPMTAIELVSARNEYESTQIVVRAPERLRINGIAFTSLRSSNGTSIPRRNLRYRFVQYEETSTVAENAFFPDREGMALYPRADLPDPLSNDTSVTVAANTTQPIFITGYVPSHTAPGMYAGTATVDTSLGSFAVPIRVRVANVTIPKTSDAAFDHYHWTMTNGVTWDGLMWNGDQHEGIQNYDVGKYYYGVETYSDDWFALMDTFATVLAEYRTNMVWLRTDLLLQATGTQLSDFTAGIPANIDWSIFDRYVETFMRHGIRLFGNQHLIHTLNFMPAEEKPNESWNDQLPDRLPATDAYLTNYLTALGKHLAEERWTTGITWYQHIRDEPIDADATNWWTYVARKIHQINAEAGTEFQTMDADPDGILLNDKTRPHVDAYVPLTPAYEELKDGYQAEQAAGKDLWVYTCEVNTPPWLNRFWTQPTATGRLLFWDLQREGIQGHLHWAWNMWYVGPWKGDSYIVYPDKKHMTVKSSLRYEAHRDGLEDNELLRLLAQRDPELAAQIVDSVISPDDPRRYTVDPAYIKMLHDYLVLAAAGEDVGPVPEPTNPYPGQDIPGTYLVDDTDPAITYTGDWFSRVRQYAYLGAVMMSVNAGEELTYEFDGAGVDVIVEKGPTAGKISIAIDGGNPYMVDLFEAVQHDYYTVYGVRGLGAGRHTISVRNAGGEVRLDGLRVHLHDGQQHYDASLQSLEISGVPPLPFDGRRTSYTVIAPADTSSIAVTPTLMDSGGSIEINGTPVSDAATVNATIPNGKSTLQIRTTASDGTTTTTYDVRLIKVAGAANATRSLSTITASAARDGDDGITYGPAKLADGDYGTMFAAAQGYTDTHPFPHEIVIGWDEPQEFDTIVMATPSGGLQGITDIDIQTSDDGTDWTTVVRGAQFRWTRHQDDGVMEWTGDELPTLTDVKHLRVQINDANYATWSMYAVYELELYALADHGAIPVE